MARYNRRPVCYMSLLVIAALLMGGRIWHVRAEQVRPHGRYSMHQILERAEPLCRLLASQASPLRMIPTRNNVHTARGELRHLWSVVCANDGGGFTSFTLWDGDTGDLIYASRPYPKPLWGIAESLDRREAVLAAARWMRAMNMSGPGSSWRLSRTPEKLNSTWRVQMCSGDRRITMGVDSRSGELVVIRSLRASGSVARTPGPPAPGTV